MRDEGRVFSNSISHPVALSLPMHSISTNTSHSTSLPSPSPHEALAGTLVDLFAASDLCAVAAAVSVAVAVA